MKAQGKANLLLLVVLLAVLAALPWLVSEYNLNLAVTMLIYSLFALSYNMLYGYGGLLSFGHAAYFGVGAYATILCIKHLGMGIISSLLAAGVLGAATGLIFGVFVVRLGGTYFALLTLAFNELIYAAAVKWRSLTGGEDGVVAMRPSLHVPVVGRISLAPIEHWYFLVLIVVVVCTAFCWYFTKTPLGRLNECLRENEDRARFIGYNTYVSKLAIYVVSTFFAGVAGGLAGAFQQFVSITFINLDKAADVLILTFIGGARIFWGPILGSFFMTWLNDAISSLTQHWALIQGTLFIVLVLYAHNGLSGLLVQLKDWLVQIVRNRIGQVRPRERTDVAAGE